MDMQQELKDNGIVLIIISKDKYRKELYNIINAIQGIISKTCYVCFNDPYNYVKSNLKKNNIPTEKFFFIDTLTKKVQNPPPANDCVFVNAPNALTEISVAVTKSLDEMHCDGAIFDTISTLLVYDNPHSIIQFVHNIMAKFRVSIRKAVFFALKDDIDSELVKDLHMFVDKVIDFDEK